MRNLAALPWPVELAVRVLAALLVPVVVVGGLLLIVPRFTELPPGIALRVGETSVGEQELAHRLDVLEALYGIRPPAEGPAAEEFRRVAAKAVAVSLVLEHAARDAHVEIADKDVDDGLAAMIDERMGGDRDAFVRLLGRVGASERDVLDEIRRQRVAARLFESATAHVPPVDDGDVRQAFDERRDALVRPEQRHLRNIVVDRRDRAEAILRQAAGGTDFGELARDHSLDGSTRASAGDLGFVTRAQLEAGYGDVAFAAAPGALFGPVQTSSGWNVGHVLEIRPSVPWEFDQVKDALRAQLAEDRARDAWHAWLSREIREADVRYADRYRPAQPDAPPGTAGGPTAPAGGAVGAPAAPR